ncbi:hypothetical protein Tco_0318376 [Tanacetum coccineum]
MGYLSMEDLEVEPIDTTEKIDPPVLQTAKQLVAKRNQERVKIILLLAIHDEYLLKFYNVADAKSLWEAIKSRFWRIGILFPLRNTSSIMKLLLPVGILGFSSYYGGKVLVSFIYPCAHDVAYSFFAQTQQTNHNLENADFRANDEDDLDRIGFLRWLSGYLETINYALMAISSSSSSSSSDSEKVVKERDELKLKIEKWEESSKNLYELLNSQMSTRDKTSLGYGKQLNELSNNSETDSEISLNVFYVRSSNEENTPANDSFSKVDGFHAVPPPITKNFLTLRADISFAGVLTRTGLITPVKQNEKRAVHKVSTARAVSTARPVSTVRPFAPKIAQTSGAISRQFSQEGTMLRPRGSYLLSRDELKFNLFSVSQMCDKKNSVLFTETECLILSPSFKLLDESQVVLRAPEQ